MTEVAERVVCFSERLAPVKGNQSAAVFRGTNVHLGMAPDRSPLARSQTSHCLQPHINDRFQHRAALHHGMFLNVRLKKTTPARCAVAVSQL